MSQKTASKKFNAYAGKIINLAEFEATLNEVQKNSYKGPSGLIAKLKDSHQKLKDPKFPFLWPVIYTTDTTAELEQATEKGESIKIGKDKIYFEASSLMAALDARDALSSSFKKSIEKSTDKHGLLDQGTLSVIDPDNFGGYSIDIESPGEIEIGAHVVPKDGSHQPPGSRIIATKFISMKT